MAALKPYLFENKLWRYQTVFKNLKCGDREIRLRYPVKTLLSMASEAIDVIGPERLQAIRYNPVMKKVPVEVALRFIDTELDILMWMFAKGLDWPGSGAKPQEAEELFDSYMDVPEEELDNGERFEEFKIAICEAIVAARGINLKKTLEAQKEAQKKAQQNAENAMKKRIEELEDQIARMSTGSDSIESQ